MNKRSYILFLICLLMMVVATRTRAEEQLPSKLQKLTEEVYHSYSGPNPATTSRRCVSR
jgi:hypothetical protein